MAMPDPIADFDLLDRAAEPHLQDLAHFAAHVCDVPMAAVNLLDRHHQHMIATYGLSPSVCARQDSLCAVTLAEDEQVVVPDARQDVRFVRNPFVTGRLASSSPGSPSPTPTATPSRPDPAGGRPEPA
jgi:GAF domain-containing protein